MDENMNNENEIVLDDENEVIEVNQENTEDVDNTDSVENSVKTYTEEEVEQIKSNLKKEYDENSQKLWNQRWAREKDKLEKENAQLYKIEDVLKNQLGANSRDELVEKLGDFYNVDMKISQNSLTERQQRILANADAEDIKSLGYDEMVQEANRIASIPKDQRTIHDEVVFNNLATTLTEQNNKKILSEKGYDLAILEDGKFKDFRKKLNYDTPLTDAVDMYNLLVKAKSLDTNNVTPPKPASAGSTKSNVTQNSLKESYTYEEAMKFSKEDFDKNPELYKRVQESMLKW